MRKDAEAIDGRVGETFSGIRVVRAFRREPRELLDYMLGRHSVLRKELFAHRRELVVVERGCHVPSLLDYAPAWRRFVDELLLSRPS